MDHGVFGYGIDLRPEHYDALLETLPAIDWIEVISDRFMQDIEQRRLDVLERVRAHYPVALHGVGLSLGSVDPLDTGYLARLKTLAETVDAVCVSDHLAWSSFAGTELDLLPLPYTEEALRHVVERVRRAQDQLGRRILLENPSSYVSFSASTMSEWEFLAAVAHEADCGILLDLNNVHVSARNHGFAALEYVRALPPGRVCQLHLAGHRDLGDVLVDTHEGPVPPAVWELYRECLRWHGPVPTIIEWDTGVPALDVLVSEALQSARIAAEMAS